MPVTTQTPLGTGIIVGLGINRKKGGFSEQVNEAVITDCGFRGDIYCSLIRKIGPHDDNYIHNDGMKKGDLVINTRQITIVEQGEIAAGSNLAGVELLPGMLRDNIFVAYTPSGGKPRFSKIPAFSRMIIFTATGPKVLYLTEENQPCGTSTKPIALYFGKDAEFATRLRGHLHGMRGQMAMVKSLADATVFVGTSFVILPPLLL